MIVIPIDNWTKMFSLCDKDGERLLVLETTSENTVLVAGTISGISFELFRTPGISLKLGKILINRRRDEEVPYSKSYGVQYDKSNSRYHTRLSLTKRIPKLLAIRRHSRHEVSSLYLGAD